MCMCVHCSVPLRYLITPSLLKVSADALKELGWREMERVPAFPGLTDANMEQRLCIPGGGITKGLYTDRYRQRAASATSHRPQIMISLKEHKEKLKLEYLYAG